MPKKDSGLQAGLIAAEEHAASTASSAGSLRIHGRMHHVESEPSEDSTITGARKRVAEVLAQRLQNGVLGDKTRIVLCMLAMGVSAFPVPETLLLQTSMFSTCFKFKRFYAKATIYLFLPGFLVQLLQNKLDSGYDLQYGSQWMAAVRVIFGHATQLLFLAVFLGGLHYDEEAGGGAQIDKRVNSPFAEVLIAVCFLGIGAGCAIVYGTYAQAVSIFPKHYHAYFFVGTYSLSWCIAPFNLVVGDLSCVVSTHDDAHWGRIGIFFTSAACFNVVGTLAFLIVSYLTREGKTVFDEKDKDLLRESSTNLEIQAELEAVWADVNSNTLFDLQLAASAPVARRIHTDRAQTKNPVSVSGLDDSATRSGDFIVDTGSIQDRSRIDGADSSPDPRVQGLGASRIEIWRRCTWVGLIMTIGLMESLLVCGEYDNLPIHGQLKSLPTLMMYSFYAAQCCGAIIVMVPCVQRVMTQPVLALLTVARAPGVAMIYVYTREKDAGVGHSGIFGDDYQVLAFYTAFMFIGGASFCQSFSAATLLFETAAERASSATVMNVLYYAAMCVASLIILAI